MSTLSLECVVIFFVLSGLVISYVRETKEKDIASYAKARFARIYSVALLAIFVTLICDTVGQALSPSFYSALEFWDHPMTLNEVIRAVTFSNELWGARVVVGSNDPYWSLGYEVPYYIVFAVTYIRRVAIAWLFLILWALFFGPYIALYGTIWFLGVQLYKFISSDRLKIINKQVAYIMLCAPVIHPVLKYKVFPPVLNIMRILPPKQYLLNFGFFMIIAILFAVHLIGFARLSASWNFSEGFQRIVRWLAGATFTIYLMHEPVLIMFGAFQNYVQTKLLIGPLIAIYTIIIMFLLSEIGERRKRLFRSIIDKIYHI